MKSVPSDFHRPHLDQERSFTNKSPRDSGHKSWGWDESAALEPQYLQATNGDRHFTGRQNLQSLTLS